MFQSYLPYFFSIAAFPIACKTTTAVSNTVSAATEIFTTVKTQNKSPFFSFLLFEMKSDVKT